MEFEWHSGKADANLRKHGISFEDAALVFLDPERIAKLSTTGRTTGKIDGRPSAWSPPLYWLSFIRFAAKMEILSD